MVGRNSEMELDTKNHKNDYISKQQNEREISESLEPDQNLPSTSGMTVKNHQQFMVDRLTDEEIYQRMSFEIMRDSIIYVKYQEQKLINHPAIQQRPNFSWINIRDDKEISPSIDSTPRKRKLIANQEDLEPSSVEPTITGPHSISNVTNDISNFPPAKRFCPMTNKSLDTVEQSIVSNGFNFPNAKTPAVGNGTHYFPTKMQIRNATCHSKQDWFGTHDTSTKLSNISYNNHVDAISGGYDNRNTLKHTLIENPRAAYHPNCSVERDSYHRTFFSNPSSLHSSSYPVSITNLANKFDQTISELHYSNKYP
ncbi:uncharacterized protein [Palaemon carinicauda]|uniref:uncharacterized protein n=1 Tax=Palaemon carinicauda TaxID=392227 RepID=UPI0035B582A0